jgi:hypothetical protein
MNAPSRIWQGTRIGWGIAPLSVPDRCTPAPAIMPPTISPAGTFSHSSRKPRAKPSAISMASVTMTRSSSVGIVGIAASIGMVARTISGSTAINTRRRDICAMTTRRVSAVVRSDRAST